MKAHHSFCDGISAMCMTLSLAEEYSRDFFVKSSDAKWYEVIFVKIMSAFSLLPLIKAILTPGDKNYITKRRDKEFSGNLNVSTSELIDFRQLKALSKKTGITINDIVVSGLSCAIK